MNFKLFNSSFSFFLFTGDNPLTACHVARELRFTKHKITLILTKIPNNNWAWQSVNEEILIPIDIMKNKKKWSNEVVAKYDLCLTGDGLFHLQNEMNLGIIRGLLPNVRVFARFDPKQKE